MAGVTNTAAPPMLSSQPSLHLTLSVPPVPTGRTRPASGKFPREENPAPRVAVFICKMGSLLPRLRGLCRADEVDGGLHLLGAQQAREPAGKLRRVRNSTRSWQVPKAAVPGTRCPLTDRKPGWASPGVPHQIHTERQKPRRVSAFSANCVFVSSTRLRQRSTRVCNKSCHLDTVLCTSVGGPDLVQSRCPHLLPQASGPDIPVQIPF